MLTTIKLSYNGQTATVETTSVEVAIEIWAEFWHCAEADIEVEFIAERHSPLSRDCVDTVKEAAAYFGKSLSTIYRWIKSGKLNATKVGRKWEISYQGGY
jgi:excisionase family DNA binding protein